MSTSLFRLLERLVTSEEGERAGVVSELEMLKGPLVVRAAVALAEHEWSELRKASIRMLRARPRSVTAVRTIARLALDPELVVRRDAVLALGVFSSPETSGAAVNALLLSLEDPEPVVREAAFGILELVLK